MGKLKQILSNETPNDHGFVVLSDGIDWSRYVNNPILRYNHEDKIASLGNVKNIRKEGANWVGELYFAKTDKAKEMETLYDEGALRAVSIGGSCTIVKDEVSNMEFATSFEVYEISLVPLPANPDAVSDYKDDVPIFDRVEFHAKEITTLSSATEVDKTLINEYKKRMEETEKKEEKDELASKCESDAEFSSQNFLDKLFDLIKKADKGAKKEDKAEEKVAESETETLEKKGCATEPDKTPETPSETKEDEKSNTVKQGADELNAKQSDTTKVASVVDDNKILDATKLKTKKLETFANVKEFLASTEGKEKFNASATLLNANPREVENSDVTHAYEGVRTLVNTLSADKGFMSFMGNIKVQLENGRYDSLKTIIDRAKVNLASGANSATFITNTPDLAVIEWLTLFYQLLLPDNSWADRCMRVSGEDKEGVIWVNSAISPNIYFGDRAPINMENYSYDDTPVGLVTKVFALQPTLWQNANNDILAYDAMGKGQAEAIRLMRNSIYNYALEKIAEAASVKIPMTGVPLEGGAAKTFASQGKFPINSASNANLYQLSPIDLLSLQTAFINQNYQMETFDAEMVMGAIYAQQIQESATLTNMLTKNAGTMRPMEWEYAGFVGRPRQTVAAYNTATSNVVDAQLYCNGLTQANGTVPAFVPPVLAETVHDIALGFIPSEVILALGNTNVHAVADPNSYSWKFSMDMRFGAGAARSNGKGIGIIAPAVAH